MFFSSLIYLEEPVKLSRATSHSPTEDGTKSQIRGWVDCSGKKVRPPETVSAGPLPEPEAAAPGLGEPDKPEAFLT